MPYRYDPFLGGMVEEPAAPTVDYSSPFEPAASHEPFSMPGLEPVPSHNPFIPQPTFTTPPDYQHTSPWNPIPGDLLISQPDTEALPESWLQNFLSSPYESLADITQAAMAKSFDPKPVAPEPSESPLSLNWIWNTAKANPWDTLRLAGGIPLNMLIGIGTNAPMLPEVAAGPMAYLSNKGLSGQGGPTAIVGQELNAFLNLMEFTLGTPQEALFGAMSKKPDETLTEGAVRGVESSMNFPMLVDQLKENYKSSPIANTLLGMMQPADKDFILSLGYDSENPIGEVLGGDLQASSIIQAVSYGLDARILGKNALSFMTNLAGTLTLDPMNVVGSGLWKGYGTKMWTKADEVITRTVSSPEFVERFGDVRPWAQKYIGKRLLEGADEGLVKEMISIADSAERAHELRVLDELAPSYLEMGVIGDSAGLQAKDLHEVVGSLVETLPAPSGMSIADEASRFIDSYVEMMVSPEELATTEADRLFRMDAVQAARDEAIDLLGKKTPQQLLWEMDDGIQGPGSYQGELVNRYMQSVEGTPQWLEAQTRMIEPKTPEFSWWEQGEPSPGEVAYDPRQAQIGLDFEPIPVIKPPGGMNDLKATIDAYVYTPVYKPNDINAKKWFSGAADWSFGKTTPKIGSESSHFGGGIVYMTDNAAYTRGYWIPSTVEQAKGKHALYQESPMGATKEFELNTQSVLDLDGPVSPEFMIMMKKAARRFGRDVPTELMDAAVSGKITAGDLRDAVYGLIAADEPMAATKLNEIMSQRYDAMITQTGVPNGNMLMLFGTAPIRRERIAFAKNPQAYVKPSQVDLSGMEVDPEVPNWQAPYRHVDPYQPPLWIDESEYGTGYLHDPLENITIGEEEVYFAGIRPIEPAKELTDIMGVLVESERNLTKGGLNPSVIRDDMVRMAIKIRNYIDEAFLRETGAGIPAPKLESERIAYLTHKTTPEFQAAAAKSMLGYGYGYSFNPLHASELERLWPKDWTADMIDEMGRNGTLPGLGGAKIESVLVRDPIKLAAIRKARGIRAMSDLKLLSDVSEKLATVSKEPIPGMEQLALLESPDPRLKPLRPLFKDQWFHPRVAEVLNERIVFSFQRSPEQEVFQMLRKFNHLWKPMALGRPGTTIRNLIGGFTQLAQAGVKNPVSIYDGFKIAMKSVEKVVVGNRIMSGNDWFRLAEDFGVPEGFISVETRDIHHALADGVSAFDAPVIGRPLKILANSNQFVENWVRVSNWIDQVGKGVDPFTAAVRVKDFHFDYLSGLPKFQEAVLRPLAPFMAFTRFNLPMQVKQFVTNPAPFIHLQQLINLVESKEKPPANNAAIMAEYIRRETPVRLDYDEKGNPRVLLLGGTIPLSDLEMLMHPGSGLWKIAELMSPLKGPFNLDDRLPADATLFERLRTILPLVNDFERVVVRQFSENPTDQQRALEAAVRWALGVSPTTLDKVAMNKNLMRRINEQRSIWLKAMQKGDRARAERARLELLKIRYGIVY